MKGMRTWLRRGGRRQAPLGCGALSIVLATLAPWNGPVFAADTIGTAMCISREFHNNIDVERYFKALIYDGMLAECHMAAKYEDISKAYASRFVPGFNAAKDSIIRKCSASSDQFIIAMAAYTMGVHVAGGILFWRRYVGADDREASCEAILYIIENGLE